MQTCQIFLYGGKVQWLDLALREFPDTRLLVVVQNRVDDPNEWWEPVEDKISQIERDQASLREDLQVKVKLLEISGDKPLAELTRYFRALIQTTAQQGFPVVCNVTAGLFEYQLALYLASQIEVGSVSEVFYHNKQTKGKNALPRATSVTRKEQRVLELIWKYTEELAPPPEVNDGDLEANLSTLRDYGATHGTDMDLSNLSRLVSKLVKKDLLAERREGRDKLIQLTEQGRIFCPIGELAREITARLALKS